MFNARRGYNFLYSRERALLSTSPSSFCRSLSLPHRPRLGAVASRCGFLRGGGGGFGRGWVSFRVAKGESWQRAERSGLAGGGRNVKI